VEKFFVEISVILGPCFISVQMIESLTDENHQGSAFF